jgi:16S rRNA (cytidine1402-2'-O)-methyltransferase
MSENGNLKPRIPEKNDPLAGTLFIVSTPIGNLKDITFRAVEVLKSADVIYAEDTRETSRLLKHYGITTPLKTYLGGYQKKIDLILNELASGKKVALVSDRGTPCINDPGYEVVREASKSGFRVVPVPGPNAALTALMVSGFNVDSFYYAGFPPKKGKEREAFLERLTAENKPVIFYESPHRLLKTLEDVLQKGLGERECLLARELTKLHEEFLRGSLKEVIAELKSKGKVRGEFVVVLGPFAAEKENLATALKLSLRLIQEGLSVKKAARLASEIHSVPAKKLYEKLIKSGLL